MKNFFTAFLLFFSQSVSFPQLAQSYFPSQLGHTWVFKVIPLDSLNNPIDSMTFYEVDSFALVQDYNGMSARYILSKSGDNQTILLQPYLDTTHLSFQNTDAYNYFKLLNFNFLPNSNFERIDSKSVTLNSENTFAFEGWFAYYRFAQTVNFNYQVFSKDTSITFDTITVPIRIELRGRRLNDETISTDLGTFVCKKFLLTTIVSYLPLPILPITLYQLRDTTWIAQNNWIVKQILPSSIIDLTAINLPRFVLPGTMKEVIPQLPTNIVDEFSNPANFNLSQNYPNPFNPSTKIQYQIPHSSFVTLKIYDIIGNEVAVLVDEFKASGSYEVEFPSQKLASGIYLYTFSADNFSVTKKMVLIR